MLDEITELQTKVMVFVKEWAETKKTTVPQREIVLYMVRCGVHSYSALDAIRALITKGYIRKAVSDHKNRTFYVMIRNI